jgi:hypothetical protein
MHRGHDHDHAHYDHANYDHGPTMAPGAGHNHAVKPRQPAQWQLLHGEDQSEQDQGGRDSDTDLDLVAAAFVEGFMTAGDPTSFLRLAKVPFEATSHDGAKLSLLRVEIDTVADIGSITPHLGGGSFRYDPLPARMVSRRKRLRLIYFGEAGLKAFDLAEAMRLTASS